MKRKLYTMIQGRAGDVTNTTTPNSSSVRRGTIPQRSLIRTAVAALLIATAACSDDDRSDVPTPGDTPNDDNLVSVCFFAQSPGESRPETRSDILTDGHTVVWIVGKDTVGISAEPDASANENKSITNWQYAPTMNGVSQRLKYAASDPKYMRLPAVRYHFYSYYPWNKNNNNATSVDFTLKDFIQNNDKKGSTTALLSINYKAEHIGPQDFMWATTTADLRSEDTKDPMNVGFTYSHIFPMLRIRNNTGQAVTRICVRSETDPVKGNLTVSLIDGEFQINSSQKAISLGFTSPLAQSDTGWLLIFPQIKEGGELIIGAMTEDGTIREVRKPLPSGGLIGGKAYDIDFNPTNSVTGNVYTSYAPPAGNGSTDTPYEISDEAELRWLALAVNYFGKTGVNAQLTKNITLDKYANWEPIGATSDPYTGGTFDGNGKTISGLNINRSDDGNLVGLFGNVREATVKNLHVDGSIMAEKSGSVGDIVGNTKNITMMNCLFTGGPVKGNAWVGGIAGNNYGSSFTGCYVSANVEGNSRIGGIVGYNSGSNGTITHCYSSGAVTGNSFAGGIVGDNISGTVTNCYATGTVTANNQAGGIAGSNSGKISNCLALGSAVVHSGTGSSTNDGFGRVVGKNSSTDNISGCAAWDGMTVAGNAITTGDGATTIHGKGINASDCLTKATYTSLPDTPDSFNPNVWDFDGETFTTYLPWNKKLFEYWNNDAKCLVPDYIGSVPN